MRSNSSCNTPILIRKQSAALLAAIKEYDANKWKAIGQKVGKPAKVGLNTLHRDFHGSHVDQAFSQDPLTLLQACEQYAKEHFVGKY